MSERYVDFKILDSGNLEMTLTDEGREFLAGRLESGDTLDLADVIEWQLCNGWEWVTAAEVGALVADDYPMITDNATFDSRDGALILCPDLYHYPMWAIRSPVQELFENGRVVFTHETGDTEPEGEEERTRCRYQVGDTLLYQPYGERSHVQSVIVRRRFAWNTNMPPRYLVEVVDGSGLPGDMYGLDEDELLPGPALALFGQSH